MSSSEDHTYELCQCPHHGNSKRTYNFCGTCSSLRQHAGKRRFPPKKKQQIGKDLSQKAKQIMKRGNDLHNFLQEENRYQNATPTKFQKGDANPFTKNNNNTTFGIDVPYHAVGQSQREKVICQILQLMGVSPNPNTNNNFEVENRGAPFTDRDRRIFSGTNLRNNLMRKNQKVSNLDENFLKNFGNPENFIISTKKVESEKVNQRQGSASVEKVA